MSKAYIILLLLTIVYRWGYGQGTVRISGVIQDAKGIGLSKANIQLLLPKDTLQTISGEDGVFAFTVKAAGKIQIDISMEGYKSFQKVYALEAGKETVSLSRIILAVAYQELESVTVKKIKPLTIKGDTLEYNAGAYTLRPGAELERLMRRLPGVHLEIDGSLLVEGKKISRVRINGQEFGGGDIRKALEYIPADIVDKVQIIDEYDDIAKLTGVKSREAEKVLNVVLKDDKRHGWIGHYEAGTGRDDRYNSILFSELISGDRQFTVNGKLANTTNTGNLYERQLSLVYSNKPNPKWMGNTELAVWGDNHNSVNSLIQDNFFVGSSQHLEQDKQLTGSNKNKLITYMETYTPDVNMQARATAFIGFYHNQELANNNNLSRQQDSGFNKNDSSQASAISQNNSLSTGSSLFFEKSNPITNQKIEFNVSYRYDNMQGEEDDQSQSFVQADSITNKTGQHLFVHTDNYSKEITASLNYYIPLNKRGFLAFGYDWKNSNLENHRIVKSPDSVIGAIQMVDSLSSDYFFSTTNSRIHMGYLKHFEQLNLSLDLDVQSWHQEGRTEGKNPVQSYDYFNLLPHIQLSYSFPSGKICHIEYSGTTTTPNLQQLQPVLDLTNPQYPVQGNPNLRPSYSQSINANYEQHSLKQNQYSGFSFGINYVVTSNMVVSDLIHPKDSSSVIQRTEFVNANGIYTLGFNYNMDFPALLNKRLKINTTGSISKNQVTIITDHIIYYGTNLSLKQGLQFTLDIPDLIEANLGGNYSHTLSQYSSGNGGTYSYSTYDWSFHARQEILHKWVLQYGFSQGFFQFPGSGLQANPIMVNGSLQRDLFRANEGALSLTASDLLNSSTGIVQNIGPTGVTQYRTNLIGRYFLLSFIFKLEKFHHPKSAKQ